MDYSNYFWKESETSKNWDTTNFWVFSLLVSKLSWCQWVCHLAYANALQWTYNEARGPPGSEIFHHLGPRRFYPVFVAAVFLNNCVILFMVVPCLALTASKAEDKKGQLWAVGHFPSTILYQNKHNKINSLILCLPLFKAMCVCMCIHINAYMHISILLFPHLCLYTYYKFSPNMNPINSFTDEEIMVQRA